MSKMRLDRYLAQMGEGSRQEVKQLIKKGHVTLNGQTQKNPEYKVAAGEDIVEVDARRVEYCAYEYFMLYKQQGSVSATKDPRERTVLDAIDEADCPRKEELSVVGRLDKDTEGLLILTNDGPLVHNLLSPKKHVEKEYFVRLREPVTKKEQEMFLRGIDIGDDKLTLPAELRILDGGEATEAYVTLTEGRFHQVKRMFLSCGNEVLYLKRVRMGAVRLDQNLKPGEYRRLTLQEIQSLRDRG